MSRTFGRTFVSINEHWFIHFVLFVSFPLISYAFFSYFYFLIFLVLFYDFSHVPFLPLLLCIPICFVFPSRTGSHRSFLAPFKGPLFPVSRPFSLLGLRFYLCSRFLWNVNKNPTRCNSMQIFIYCKVTLHVLGVPAPIIRSTKNCNCNLRYSYFAPVWPAGHGRRLRLQFLVLLMMGAVTPETCRVILQ